MKSIIAFFKSVKLAVALIVVIALFSILATFVPQGRDEAYYAARYPAWLAEFILASGFRNFFGSLLFLVPAALLFVSCAVCLADGLARRIAGRAPRRFGPDLIHAGVLLLIAGGVVSGLGRREEAFYLGAGDRVNVAGAAVLTLESFTVLTYPDGRPSDWISTVRVERGGKGEPGVREIRVNAPLILGDVTVYQYAAAQEYRARIAAPGGAETWIGPGYVLEDGPDSYRVTEVVPPGEGGEGGRLVLERHATDGRAGGEERGEPLSLAAGGSFGPYAVRAIESRPLTGLQAVRDPGLVPVAVALALVAAGLCLTYVQKLVKGRKP